MLGAFGQIYALLGRSILNATLTVDSLALGLSLIKTVLVGAHSISHLDFFSNVGASYFGLNRDAFVLLQVHSLHFLLFHRIYVAHIVEIVISKLKNFSKVIIVIN